MSTWTPVPQQSEIWTSEAPSEIRVFDPFVFARLPVFDTGKQGGIWDRTVQQIETWTVEA